MTPNGLLIAVAVLALAEVRVSAAPAPAEPWGPRTEFIADGDPCDWVSRGRSFRYDEECCNFQVVYNTNRDLTQILGTLRGAQIYFRFFSASDADGVRAGLYPHVRNDARGMPGPDAPPGMQITYLNPSLISGSLAILDLQVNRSTTPPRIMSFAAAFIQHMKGNNPALVGHVYYNYTPTCRVTVSQPDVVGGDVTIGTITIPSPASTDVRVRVESSSAFVVTPQFVEIPRGSTAVSFPITTTAVRQATRAIIYAKLNDVAHSVTVRLLPRIEPMTVLELKGEPGDFILSGRSVRYVSGSDGCLVMLQGQSYAVNGKESGVGFSWYGPSSFWDVHLQSKSGSLEVGRYEDARRWKFHEDYHGLEVGGSPTSSWLGRGCNTLVGAFEVFDIRHDAEYAPGLISSFSGSFEQYCEGSDRPLTGRVLYNYVQPKQRSVRK